MKKITFNKYSGLRIRGKVPVELEDDFHLSVASFITTAIESGNKFGTVMNYDGTGMTAGIHQAIAVYPRASTKGLLSQGPLWKLLSRMSLLDPAPIELVNLVEEMNNFGLFLGEDGRVRIPSTGGYAKGTLLREFFGTPKGVLSSERKDIARAERLIQLFHGLMKDSSTFKLQLALGKEHFVKASERSKLRFSRIPRTKCSTIQNMVYGPLTGKHITTLNSVGMDPELNLAMCMFWSYFVNAPGMAMKKMCKVIDSIDRRNSGWGEKFSRLLVRKLGTSSYGRWDDDIDSGRYQRTRKELKKYFPKGMFLKRAIMPKDFPGG